MSTTIKLQVVVTDDELRRWAEWHVEHHHHGVAAVLYAALEKADTISDAYADLTEENKQLTEEVARLRQQFQVPPSNP